MTSPRTGTAMALIGLASLLASPAPAASPQAPSAKTSPAASTSPTVSQPPQYLPIEAQWCVAPDRCIQLEVPRGERQ